MLGSLGYQVYRMDVLHSSELRTQKLISANNIRTVLDVGANTGQFGHWLRSIGFTGQIISFEPLRSAFETLQRSTRNDQNWTAHNFALGDSNEIASLKIAENTQCSSLVSVKDLYIKTAPLARPVALETVEVTTLDRFIGDYGTLEANVLLKLDVQGYEKKVLDGGMQSLKSITGIHLEMSLEELYVDETLFDEMIAFLKLHNFSLMSLNPVHVDSRSGQILQVDGTFFRRAN